MKLIQLQHSPLFVIFRASTRSLNRHSFVAQGHLHTIHLTYPGSTLYSPSTYFRHQHLSGHTVFIHSFHMPKPSKYSLVGSTRLFPFYFSSSTHLFIRNSIHSWHSGQTSQTLYLKDIYFPSLNSSHTPCLLSVQRRWYNNYFFILTLLCLYPQSSTAQHIFQCSYYQPPSFILCPTSLSHPSSASTCDPRYLQQSFSSDG